MDKDIELELTREENYLNKSELILKEFIKNCSLRLNANYYNNKEEK